MVSIISSINNNKIFKTLAMKKFLIGLGFCLLGFFAQAQNGLEGIVVEKYYIANAADAAGSAGVLPEGSVTYRIYVDMLPNYKFQAAFGNSSHSLKLETTTSFFNNEDYGALTPSYSAANAKKNTVMLDSWLSAGAAVAGKLGVMKSEDDGVANYLPFTSTNSGFLLNSVAAMGTPLTTQDGISSSTTLPSGVTFVGTGDPGTETDVFDATSQLGNSFILTNGGWSSLVGATGPTANNRVLIAQITTNGVFHYELNIQIGTPSGDTEKYVVSSPAAGELTIASLVGTLGAPNSLPTITLAGATTAVVGEVKTYTATASDTDGTIANVVFKVNGTAVATVTTAPYTYDYTAVLGNHSITAVATDDQGGVTTSAPVALSVTAVPVDPAPVVIITAPAGGSSSKVGVPVTITATATDNGPISQVEFFDGATSLGVDMVAPYSATYTPTLAGTHILTAKATDNKPQVGTSAPVSTTVAVNVAPVVTFTTPASGNKGIAIALTATATDADGTVTKVEFFDGTTLLGSDNTVPYEASLSAAAATVGTHTLKAVATDDNGATSEKTVTVVIATVPPVVTFTTPATGDMGTPIALTATATDADGTVSKIEFFVNGVSLIVDNTPVDGFTATFPAATAGSFTLKAVATDDNLATGEKSVTVVISDASVKYEIGQTSKNNVVKQFCFVNPISIPVYSTQASMTGVIGYDLALIYDASQVVPTGKITVSNALLGTTDPATITSYVVNIDAARSLMNISIFFNGKANAASMFRGAGELFSAEFTKKPDFAGTDALFSMKDFVESYRTNTQIAETEPGTFRTEKDNVFNGSLKFWKDNSAIKYDVANPNDYLITDISGYGSSVKVQPDLFGNFKHITTNGTTIDITRDIANAEDVHSVIMSADALAAAYIANKNATVFRPNVFNMIAADVNLDGAITAGDASQINLRAIGEFLEFAQNTTVNPGPSKDWLFVNSATLSLDAYKISGSYPEDDGYGFSKNWVPRNVDGGNVGIFTQNLPWADWTGCPEIVGDVYTGIMLGDVNGDYATITNDGKLKSATISNDVVTLDFSKAKQVGNVVTVPVSVSTTLAELHAIDLGIIINDEKIENITVNDPIFQGKYHADTKKLNVGGFSFTSISKSNTFSLTITKKNSEALQASDFEGVQVDLTNNPMSPIVKGRLNVIDQVATGISEPGIDSAEPVLVYPNPANDHLNVKVSEDSDVQIFDMSSKLLIQTTVKVGVNDIRGIQNLSNGIYMMKISNGKTTSMHKVIIKK
jgi:hypothetical protein